jgi:regulator of RNase E activity RraA
MFALGLPDAVLDTSVKLLAGKPILGRAVTIGRTYRPNNGTREDVPPEFALAIQEVIDTAPAGSILVTAVQGVRSHANWGANQALRASLVGITGVVTDGPVRDLNEMQALGVSVFAQGTSPRSGQDRFTTTVKNGPVICAGVLIKPGDILLGDEDGVIVICPDDAAAIAVKARQIDHAEEQMRQHVLDGGKLEDAVRKYKSGRPAGQSAAGA